MTQNPLSHCRGQVLRGLLQTEKVRELRGCEPFLTFGEGKSLISVSGSCTYKQLLVAIYRLIVLKIISYLAKC